MPILHKRDDRKPKTITQQDFASMVRARRREIANACTDLTGKVIDIEQFAERLHLILVHGHTQGWYLGRRLAGDHSPLNQLDKDAGSLAADLEAAHLQDFAAQLADDTSRLYTAEGELRESLIQARANLYTGKFRATAADAFVATGDDDDLYDWVLGGAEEHCADCPEMAALSPYSKITLFAYPGSGDTACLGNCKCSLVRRSDGKASFGPL